MINKDLKTNIKKIKQDTNNNQDYKFKKINFLNETIILVFNSALTNNDKIDNFILKSISLINNTKPKIKENTIDFLYNYLPTNSLEIIDNYEDLYNKLNIGFAIILSENNENCLSLEMKEDLTRAIAESQVEKTINGPKDAFVENYLTNIGLIKRRIKSNNLKIEELTLGEETKTKVEILYMKNIAEEDLVKQITDEIKSIKIDGIIDSSYIRNRIIKNNPQFPMVEMTERPDLTSMSLLEGKICVIVDTSPFVLIMPTFFIDFFHSPEDYYQRSKNISFTRIIRFVAFLIAIITPAFYIAITTYNHETIPSPLLINLVAQRAGVPFPAFLEALAMIITFEILRESDIRLPSQMGSAISILGGIILGDAAVAAGIVSPIMVIVVAITAISGLIFSHLDVVNAIRSWRIVFMIFASILGIIGIFFCSFLFIATLASYKSFGKPYLYPLSPINFAMLKDSFIRVKTKKHEKNPLLVKDLEEKF